MRYLIFAFLLLTSCSSRYEKGDIYRDVTIDRDYEIEELGACKELYNTSRYAITLMSNVNDKIRTIHATDSTSNQQCFMASESSVIGTTFYIYPVTKLEKLKKTN